MKKEILIKCVLDSGAYACWRKGEEINIQDYCDWLLNHKDYYVDCVNLDVIPGEPNRYPTVEEVEESAKQSYENLQIMKARGLNPIPVFHQGESFEWLKRYIKEEPYIGISPAGDQMGWRGPGAEIWLDKVFDLTTDEAGVPLVKTHGFGITAAKYLKRYPWFSCDSTSWTQIANFGTIIVPRFFGGKPDYLGQPHYVHVSDYTHRVADEFVSAKDKSKHQFGNLGKLEQERVIWFVTEVCNLTMTGVRYCDNERRKLLITFWSHVIEAVGDVSRFKFKKKWSML